MTQKIVSVKPMENCILRVGFQNGIEKTYDMRILYPIFPQFEVFETDKELFKRVQVDMGGYGIFWNDELDLDANDIWEDGIEVAKKEIDIVAELAVNLVKARESVNITQKELAEKTGIYQADISKIERGLANPSLSTLKRLAAGLGMELHLVFTPTQKVGSIDFNN